MNIVINKFVECTCPLCDTSANSDSGYFARAFSDPKLLPTTSEAMTDTLGFCLRHGTSLLSQERLLSGDVVVQVLHDAIPRIMMLLNEKYLLETRVQQTLFGADHACPACTHANRAVGRHAASLARQFSSAEDQAGLNQPTALCVGHFQILSADFTAEQRLDELTHYADHLEHAARTMKMLLRTLDETDVCPIDNAAATLNRALGLVAGRPMFELPSLDARFADSLELCPTLVEAISLPEVCPLCIETARARQRWLQNAQKAAEFDDDAWLIFPTCPEHVWTVARLGEPRLTTAVVARALSVALRYFRQQIQILIQAAELREEEARIKAEGPEFWAAYKRKRAQRKTPGPKTPPHRLAKCPGCERIDIALDRATDSLLDLLHKKAERKAFSEGYGLCMKHFAHVYLMAPKGIVRSMLAEDQQRRLAALSCSIGNTDREIQENEVAQLRDISVKQALRRFCGFM
jgi:hypothetical protein